MDTQYVLTLTSRFYFELYMPYCLSFFRKLLKNVSIRLRAKPRAASKTQVVQSALALGTFWTTGTESSICLQVNWKLSFHGMAKEGNLVKKKKIAETPLILWFFSSKNDRYSSNSSAHVMIYVLKSVYKLTYSKTWNLNRIWNGI